MNILVVSKLSIPARNQTIPQWDYCRGLGHEVWVEKSGADLPAIPDVIISMGIGVLEETIRFVEQYPNALLFCYQWDCYDWTFTRPRRGEYNYDRQAEMLLKNCTEMWCASAWTGAKTTEWWGLENWEVILSSCPWWEYPQEKITDGGYALCCLRQIPDLWWGQFAKACEELGISYKLTRHQQSFSNYQDAVANCRFLVADLNELSTGGLSLMEGYYHGKPCLISDIPSNGGRDYLGNRAAYYRNNDFERYKDTLWNMYTNTPKVAGDHKEYITTNFSDKVMIDKMLERVKVYV